MPRPLQTAVSVPNGMLAQQGDNGNRARHHLKLPRAALTRSQATRTTLTAEDRPTLAEPVRPLHRCRHANHLRWTTNNPATGG